MKYIYSASHISKLSLTLRTFSITDSVAGLFLTSLSREERGSERVYSETGEKEIYSTIKVTTDYVSILHRKKE